MRTGYKKIPLFFQKSAVTDQERSGGCLKESVTGGASGICFHRIQGALLPPLSQACRSLPAPGRKPNFLSVIVNHGETQVSREISHILRQITQLFPRLNSLRHPLNPIIEIPGAHRFQLG